MDELRRIKNLEGQIKDIDKSIADLTLFRERLQKQLDKLKQESNCDESNEPTI